MKKTRPITANPPPCLIVYERLGQICLRRRPSMVHDPMTPRQLMQREKFSLAVSVAKAYADQLSPSWHEYARSHRKTGLNLLIGQILRRAVFVDSQTGHPFVDTSKIDLQHPWL